MKRLIAIFFCFTLLIPAISSADEPNDWTLSLSKDDFTDGKRCCLHTKNTNDHNSPGIVILINHDKQDKAILLYAKGGIVGIGITYRVDKNIPETIGHDNHLQTKLSGIAVRGSDYDKLINDFKKGTSVVYQVHSGNQFVQGTKERVSLIGFTKAYSICLGVLN